MTSHDRSRIALVALPTLIAFGLFADAFSQRNHFVQDSEQRQQVERLIQQTLKSLESQQNIPEGRKAAVPEDAVEESQFLNYVRGTARANEVEILRWSANPRLPAGPPGGPPPPAALAEISPISGLLEVVGPYRSVLAFARTLEQNDRLLNFSSVAWTRPDARDKVRLSMIVTRYVVKAPTPPAPAATPVVPAH
ncbi:hypothetical protein [Fimbriimonas ginsengisoli]|uniref:Uncharacterized protein n=1 Tax=Fimbriimonas ginsengisoli Gsoil 348 TaxID=661478 RepID=A0A068NKB2_FIMGI|nr:hypothetical protein [Fimbriimonas ginsengisoli]AIE84008.1 hypothetical protein OP10G_0640 [Fimbriimonas ginsengisoli Gsoil 348]